MESKPKKVLIIGGDKSEFALIALREKFGDDVEMVTPDEARERGFGADDFVNTPRMKITAPPIIENFRIAGPGKTGREKRRDRRRNERKSKKG